MKGTIVYIGNFLAPMGDAVAKRAVGLGLSFIHAGYSYKMIGESNSVSSGQISSEESYNGINYCNIHRSRNSYEHFFYLKDLALIKRQIVKWNKSERIVAVIICGTKCALMANQIVSFCKRKHIPIYSDSMDWLVSNTGNHIFDLIKNADTKYELNHVNRRVEGIICISTFLCDYYSRLGIKTITIPPLSPYTKNIVNNKNNIIKFVYAGVPCRLDKPLINPEDAKDRLDLVIEVFYQLYLDGKIFEFDIYGLTQDQYGVAFPRHNKIIEILVRDRLVEFHGRVNEDIVKQAIIKSDFTILLRNKNLTTQAGFSTKIAESVALGTPVITNDTSDVLKYICDGYDSVIVDIDNCSKMIERVSELFEDSNIIRQIHFNVLNNNSFSPKSYSDALNFFIAGDNNAFCS